MKPLPQPVSDFLASRRIAVAGVSRERNQPANLVFNRLRDTGHEVVAVNPHATEIDGEPCYPDLAAVPGNIDAVMVVTPPSASAEVVRQAAERGIGKVWFHRSFGDGSVSDAAVAACRERGIVPIVGGCPLMYSGTIDLGHRCFRWWLRLSNRVPG